MSRPVRVAGLAAGLLDYKVAAIDADWSGLLFAPGREARRSAKAGQKQAMRRTEGVRGRKQSTIGRPPAEQASVWNSLYRRPGPRSRISASPVASNGFELLCSNFSFYR